MAAIKREPKDLTVNIGVTAAASTEIDISEYSNGSFQLPAASGTTEVTIYAKVGSTNAYEIAKDDDYPSPSDLKVAVTAGIPYPLPPNAYNYGKIKLVASAGTATNDVPVFLKG